MQPLNNTPNQMVITGVNMPFISMILFIIKFSLASIPAFIIMSIIMTLFTMIFGGILMTFSQ